MKEPMDMPKAYVSWLRRWSRRCILGEATYSAPFQLFMFMLAGIGGYLFMGNEVGVQSWRAWSELRLME